MGRMTICADMYSALAECCLIQRERAITPAISAPERPLAVLVIVHPRHMPSGSGVRLVEAVRQYAPSIALWRYDRGANPKLRAVVTEDVTSAFALPAPAPVSSPAAPIGGAAGASVAAPARASSEFTPKLVNGTGHAPAVPIARPARGSPLLTEEELRMLLSGDANDLAPFTIRPVPPPSRPGGPS